MGGISLFESINLDSYWPFLVIAGVSVSIAIIVELINMVTKLRERLEHIHNQQNRIYGIVEKMIKQINRLDNKLFFMRDVRDNDAQNLTPIITEKKDMPGNFITNQLEFNIEGDTKYFHNDILSNGFLTWDILLKALHFPNDKNDSPGFIALDIARKSNIVSQCLQASEDFLNLLAQDGIYLDDLKIESPPAQAWVNFVKNEKNQQKRRLRCIGIEKHIEKLKIRMRSDTIFRDTSLILLRRFDMLLQDHLGTAQDYQIFKIAETRSGKAFLIVGQISDIF